MSQYERSAALAVFHGDLRAAVGALQRGAQSFSQRLNDDLDTDVQPQEVSTYHITTTTTTTTPHSFSSIPLQSSRNKLFEGMSYVEVPSESSAYVELLQLVAMCIAGYSNATAPSQDMGGGGGRGKAANTTGQLWKDMCESLLERPQMQARSMVSYLRAACAFLASIADPTIGSPEAGSRRLSGDGSGSGSTNMPYRRVLQDPDISLADRAAFACRFLPPAQLKAFLRQQGVSCLEEGNLEGILLFGLEGEGLHLLQAYVDRTGDIQTAGLLTSRVLAWPERGRDDVNVTQEWIEGYRDLLDTCQLWHERAIFDVGRADHLSRLRRRYMAGSSSNNNSGQGAGKRIGRKGSIDGADGEGVKGRTFTLATAPPQLYVRCNYCNVSTISNTTAMEPLLLLLPLSPWAN